MEQGRDHLHKPHARVVKLKRQRKIPTPIKQRRIPSRRIVDIILGYRAVESTVDLCQNHKVMSMKMDEMRCRHSLFARNLLNVASIDDEIDEAAVPAVIRVVHGCLVDVVEVAVVLDVEDAGSGVIEEERFVGEFPSIGAWETLADVDYSL